MLLLTISLRLSAQSTTNQMNQTSYFKNNPFLWGAASASYQVEGAPTADGKGQSNWDEWMNRYQVAGKGVNGNVAINFYDRTQYLKDIKLFKGVGLTSYRFSISWPRIIPTGTGKVNTVAIDHYRTFVKDLKAAGIEPVMTLYHWDMPLELYNKGGWDNRQSIEWFADYARVVFDNFKDLVKVYVISNEILIETDMTLQAKSIISKENAPFSVIPAPENLATALNQFNHKLLAAARAAKIFHTYGIPQGEAGIAIPLFPTIAVDAHSAKAAEFIDGIVNRWFLDAIYKGSYPQDILEYAAEHRLHLKIGAADAKEIGEAGLTYLGINYYAPLIVQKNDDQPGFYGITFPTLPNTDYAYNGANRPDQLKRLLLRMRNEYGNPAIIITENGAGFENDDLLSNGQVNDVRRAGYIKAHIEAMLSAKREGVNVFGYHVWSSHDNLEWIAGYGRRFGMIYVDFDTQQRTVKASAKEYGEIIKQFKSLK
jgi:beta-glucosidase